MRIVQNFESRKYIYIKSVLLFVTLLFLSVQYKVDNQEAIRPLYTLGLVFAALVSIASLFRLKSSMGRIRDFYFNPGLCLLYLFLGYLFLMSSLSGLRQFKDALYLLFWLTFIPSSLLLFFKQRSYEIYLVGVSKIIVWFAVFASTIAILVFMRWLELNFGEYSLVQNYWTAFRAHGFMGQPTALGGLIGIALIFLTYLKPYNRHKTLIAVQLFLLVVLLISGSRSAIVSLLLCYTPFYFGSKISTNYGSLVRNLIFPLVLFVFIFITVLFGIDTDVGSLNRRLNDFGSENSRLYIWANVAQMFFDKNSIASVFLGSGSGALVATYQAAFNSALQILYDYGVIGASLYLLSFGYSLYIGVLHYTKSRNPIYKLGLMLVIYGFVFNLFISSFLSPFFSFHVLSMILGAMIVNIPVRRLSVN